MKVLITGNQGYIGPVLALHLARQQPNWGLVGVDEGFFAPYLTGPDADFCFAAQIRKDVRDITASDIEGIDAVVHLAAVSNDPIGKEFESATHQINAAASARLARLCRDAGVKSFVFASSCSMYGAGSEMPRKEIDQLNPLTAYALSKAETEQQICALGDENFSVTCLRFATAGGASPRLRLDLVLNDFVASAVHTGRIVVLSDGSPWRPLIHTEDMALAIEWALLRRDNGFLAVNAGSKQWTWQMGQLASDVADVLGGVNVSINTNAQPDKRSYRVDFSLFEKLAPKHQPRKRFEQAVVELAQQVKHLSLDGERFRESDYIRLNVLRKLKAAGKITSELRRVEASNQTRSLPQVQFEAS